MATLLNDHQKAEEIRFILDESQWPAWPILPIKRRPEVDGEDNEAVILAWAPTTIHYMLIWDIESGTVGDVRNQVSKARTEEFETLEAMIDAGWLVD